jgi:hypothetical protein
MLNVRRNEKKPGQSTGFRVVDSYFLYATFSRDEGREDQANAESGERQRQAAPAEG